MLTLIQSTNLTFTSSAQSTGNLSFYPTAYTGNDPKFQKCVSFIQFDLPPVNAVDSAYIQLSVIAKGGKDSSKILVNRVTGSFDTSTVTHSTRPSYISTPLQIDIETSDLYSSVKIDITDMVNNMLNGTYENNGIALTNEDKTTVQFATDMIGYEPYYPVLILTCSAPYQSVWKINSEVH